MFHLECYETDKKIPRGEKFYLVGRFNDPKSAVLRESFVSKIPQGERIPSPCSEETLEGWLGIDIYEGVGTEKTLPAQPGKPIPIKPEKDKFLYHPAANGKFLFSLSRETMEKYARFLHTSFPKRYPPQKKKKVA